MTGFVVLIGHQPYEAAGPFRSREGAESLADAIRETGVAALIVPLSTGRTAREFYAA